MAIVYQTEFSLQARARVEAERLRARRDLEQARAEKPPEDWEVRRWDQCAFYAYIARVVGAFAREACELGRQGTWMIDRIRAEVDEFIRLFSLDAYYEDGHDRFGRRLPEIFSGAYLERQVTQTLRNSREWREFEEELLQVAEAQASRDIQRDGSDQAAITKESKGTVESGTSQPLGQSHSVVSSASDLDESGSETEATNQRVVVDLFIAKLAEVGRKITKKDIWSVAGYKSRTEFERFQRGDQRATQSAAASSTGC